MSHPHLKEISFESVIEQHLLNNSYQSIPREQYNKAHGFFPHTVIDFIKHTQEKTWHKLETLLCANTE
jgi:type I restriction enzyme R subunit